MRVLAALVAVAAAAEPPLPEPDYVSLAKAAYRAGMADRLNCHPPRGTRAPGERVSFSLNSCEVSK